MQHYGYIILASSCAFWLLTLYGIKRSMKNSQLRAFTRYRLALLNAQKKVHNLEQKIDIFRQYDTSYLHTLTSNGFPKIKVARYNLRSCIAIAEECFAAGNVADATTLLLWISNQKKRAPNLAIVSKPIQDQLEDWQKNTRSLIVQLTDAVAQVAQENIAIGTNRPKKNRRPTLANMHELRRWIMQQ
jgi:hypothetical protein